MDRGAWWARVHRVTQSWIQLKRLSVDACMSDLWMSKIIDSWMIYILRTEDLKKKKKKLLTHKQRVLEPGHSKSSFFVDDAELRTVDEQRERLVPNRAPILRKSRLSCQFLFVVSLREKLCGLIRYLEDELLWSVRLSSRRLECALESHRGVNFTVTQDLTMSGYCVNDHMPSFLPV